MICKRTLPRIAALRQLERLAPRATRLPGRPSAFAIVPLEHRCAAHPLPPPGSTTTFARRTNAIMWGFSGKFVAHLHQCLADRAGFCTDIDSFLRRDFIYDPDVASALI
jgi:hypothetical protein